MSEKLPYKAEWAINNIKDLVTEYNNEIASLKKQVQDLTNTQGNVSLKPYHRRTIKFSESHYDSWQGKYIEKELVDLAGIKDYYEKDKIIHEENLKIIETNKASVNAAILTMKSFGLEEYKYVKKSSRSSKEIKVTCAWVEELRAKFSTYDNWHGIDSEYKEIIQKREDKIKEKAELERKNKLEAENKAKEENFKLLVVELTKKYNLDANTVFMDVEDIKRLLASRNKYLYLAHFLALNRGDWSDGYSYAQQGLDTFVIDEENDMDMAIYNEITSLCEDFDDGRVFRDCEWNYSRLYDIVRTTEPELYEDYAKLDDFV